VRARHYHRTVHCGVSRHLPATGAGRGGAAAEKYLIYWPAVEALKTSAFSPTPAPAVAAHLGLAALYVAVLFAASYVVWSWRTRVWARYPTS